MARISDEVRYQFHGFLVPALVAILAYLGNAKMDTLAESMADVQENTMQIALISERALRFYNDVSAIDETVSSHDRHIERLATQIQEIDRRIQRCERRLDLSYDGVFYLDPLASFRQRRAVFFDTVIPPWRISL